MKRATRRRAAILILLATAVFSSCRLKAPDSLSNEPPAAVEEMVAVLDEQRWVEPRLSGGVAHGHCAADCESDEILCEPRCRSAATPETGRHNSAERVSLWMRAADRESATRHAEALLAIVGPRHRGGLRQTSAEKAVQMLKELAMAHPSDARIHSDLAAAYLVRAQRSDRPEDLIRALETTENAVRMDPRLPPPRFNQALLRETLGLRSAAQVAWRLYLSLDPITPWAEEARERLDALHEPGMTWSEARSALAEASRHGAAETVEKLVDPFRLAARLLVEEELLPGWAEARSSGDEETARARLAEARQIATALVKLTGDPLLGEAVGAIDAAAEDPGRERHLVAGHVAYAEALRTLRDFDPRGAAELYQRARNELTRGASPFEDWATVGLATSRYFENRYREALGLVRPLRKSDVGTPSNLLGRVYWIEALCESVLAHPLEALHAYRQALKRFEETGERESAVNLHARLADLFRTMGAGEQAWHHRFLALRGLPRLHQVQAQGFLLIEATTAASDLELPASALLFQDEALRLARRDPDNVLLAEVLRHHAAASLSANLPEQALRDLREASDLASIVASPQVRRIVQARIHEVEADAHEDSDSWAAVRELTAALDLLPREGLLRYRTRLLLKRARAFRKAGSVAESEADLAAALLLLEKEWEQVLENRLPGEHEELWAAYFEHDQEIFDLMIDLLVGDGRHEAALSYSERSRARELLDLVSDLPAERKYAEPYRPLSAGNLRERLPEGRVLVTTVEFEERLLIWEIRRRGSKLHVQDVKRSRLAELTETVRAYADRDATVDVHGALTELHRLLLGPFIAGVGADEELIFIPDGSLQGVPFAALRDRASGRYLVEDHVLSVAPSATFYLYSLRRDAELPRVTAPSVLLIGNPAFDRDRYRNLSDLPEALAETHQIAAEYPRSVRLEGARATRGRLLAELGRHEVVHFAGHAIPYPQAPFRSSLVLAPSGEHLGALYAQELLGRDLGRTRLVVFSACSTAGGRPIGSLAVSGLVRPVLGAGVPAVLGTLWDVKSKAATRLFTVFHHHLGEGESAATALRLAQMEMLEGNVAQSDIRSWAPFQLIGVATFNESK